MTMGAARLFSTGCVGLNKRWPSCCQQPAAGHVSLWLWVFLHNGLKLCWRMLCYWNHILQTDTHLCLFILSSSLPLYFCPPLSKVRHHWMGFYPWGSALHRKARAAREHSALSSQLFQFLCYNSFQNIIRNPQLAIMDLYSIAGSHLSHQVTLPGLFGHPR